MKNINQRSACEIFLISCFIVFLCIAQSGCQQKKIDRVTRPDFPRTIEDKAEMSAEGYAINLQRMAKDPVCMDLANTPGAVWYGSQRYMTFEQLAAYAGPVLWFSPDEPLLEDKTYKDINMPMAMPFEANPGKPVVYYRFRNVIAESDTEYEFYQLRENNLNKSIIDLKETAAVDLDYYFYYPKEEGFAYHPHDIESTLLKITIKHRENSKQCPYAIVIEKVQAKAHGVKWYDNVLVVDKYTKFPIHIFVEEGKHASCPDKNQDGYYTPSYDVNRRINDAWGVRDTIRSGKLLSGKYKSWMSKVRHDEHRVFPPLPVDSPLRKEMTLEGEYAPMYNKYILRPFPKPEAAVNDERLYKMIKEKKHEEWPSEISGVGDKDAFNRWVEEDNFTRGVSVAARGDNNELGITIIFPLLVVKRVELPMTGGYLVNRVYLKDHELRDFGWGIMYTPSASRWVDWYVTPGLEVDETGTATNVDFVLEGGVKFRTRIPKLGWWGFRFGIKNKGYPHIDNMGYVVEFGMGAF